MQKNQTEKACETKRKPHRLGLPAGPSLLVFEGENLVNYQVVQQLKASFLYFSVISFMKNPWKDAIGKPEQIISHQRGTSFLVAQPSQEEQKTARCTIYNAVKLRTVKQREASG